MISLTSANIVSQRHQVVSVMRNYLISHNYQEVQTPILHIYPDITPTPQFETQHPISKQSYCLRVAPTEHLKRLIVRGAQRVFEFATCFRPEIPDATHLEQFLSLEAMAVNADVYTMQDLVEAVIKAILKDTQIAEGTGYSFIPPDSRQSYDLSPEKPWAKVSLTKILREKFGFSEDDFFSERRVLDLAIEVTGTKQFTNLSDALDKIIETISKSFSTPVFIADYPDYLGGPASPTKNPRFKQRSELFIGGMELANMSSNLNNPDLLEKWYRTTCAYKENFKIEPNNLDQPLLAELTGNFPKSAVCGIGVERLIMVCFGYTSIQQVALLTDLAHP
jgi:lysyl-tRNA synthetase class II